MCYVNNVLDIERTAFEKRVAVLVLEICLSEKALMEVQVDLEIEDSGGKTTLLNTKEAEILYKPSMLLSIDLDTFKFPFSAR